MLKRLHIKNFSLIRDIVVNFEDDFSVITGPTIVSYKFTLLI